MIVLLAAGSIIPMARAATPPLLSEMVVPALEERLSDRDTSVRQAAVFALREMGPAAIAAIPALAQRLRDEDSYVAVDAAHTLARMGAAAVPSLVLLLQDSQPRSPGTRRANVAADRTRRQGGRVCARPAALR